MTTSLVFAGLVLSPIFGALLIVVLALNNARRAQILALLSLAISLGAAAAGIEACRDGGVLSYSYAGWTAPIGIEARLDGIAAALAMLIAALATGVCLYAGRSLRAELPRDIPAFYAMSLLLVAALQGMTTTADLFNLYVFLEISSLSAYALIAIGGGAASLASFRYLLIGTVGASFYLLGVAFLFALTGSLNAHEIATILQRTPPSAALNAGLALLTVGLGLKMAVFPMHGWLPDAYTYAPSATSALIGGVMTKVSALALLRVLYAVFAPGQAELLPAVTTVLGILGAAGIVFGSVMALAQRDLKRLLAYSSIAHLGYIAVGISLGNATALAGAVFHMLAHGLAKATLFLVAGGVVYRFGRRNLDSLAGLHRTMPLSTAAFVVASLSMIGIPPTAGFFSKWYLMIGCLEAGRTDLFVLVVASTLLSAWYFLRLFEAIFFVEPPKPRTRDELPTAMLLPVGAAAAAILALGLGNQFAIGELIEPTPLLQALGQLVAR